MARLGPFEPAPLVAVAVSGGADSMAACLLAATWARARGGAAVGLIVDHRLRTGSADEAEAVARWLADRGIAADILAWHHPPALSRVQETARAARYALLAGACAARGTLHLVLGHHRDDQAETVRMRLSRRTGLDGLAGMAGLRELPAVRLLRPLLDLPKDRLRATCLVAGQPWVEDPSNADAAYDRARLRGESGRLAALGADGEVLADIARRAGRVRARLDVAAAQRLATCVTMQDEGYVVAGRAALAAPPDAVAHRALARCLATVSGATHPPARATVARLLAALQEGAPGARTAAGCLVQPYGRDRTRVLICREPSAAAGRVAIRPGQTVRWDGRFGVACPDGLAADEVRRLGLAVRRAEGHAVPTACLASLPGLWRDGRLVAIPGPEAGPLAAPAGLPRFPLRFDPDWPLAGPAFAVV